MTYGTLITTSTAGAGGIASFDFTSIPSTYQDLIIVFSARSDRAAGVDVAKITFNASGSSYNDKQLLGFGTGAGYTEANATSYIVCYGANGDTSTASTFGNTSIYIPNYAGSTNKPVGIDQSFETNATGAWVGIAAAAWANTSAISRVTIAPLNGTIWKQYSTASLYGIK